MRRAAPPLLVAGALGAFPAAAEAHGLAQRANLPIPEWLFGWAAAVVLVASFAALAALWPTPRLERPSWRPLPGGIGRMLGSRAVDWACRVVGVALFAIVVAAGYAGESTPLDNLAPTFILIVFWVGLVFVSVLFGDVFRAFSPWRAFRFRGLRPYPEKLGRYPAAAGLLGFTWIELVSGWGEDPSALTTAAVVYTVYTLAAQLLYGTEAWSRNGEAFSVYFGLFARISPFERRDGVVGVRPPLGGLPSLDPLPGTVLFVSVMIGTVTFDGLSQGEVWRSLSVDLVDAFHGLGIGVDTGVKLASTIGLVAGVLLVGGFYRLGIDGAHSVGGGLSAERLRRGFVHSLVPIAMVYVAAHYLTFLLFEGQAIGYLASDPFGRGWDLFGTASASIDFNWLSQNAAWYLQVAFVVLGHVAALALAHDRALVLYGQAKLAVRSQYWMLGVMVGFTTLALWLLAQAGAG
ncbi:MAG TPA: fenitrothion hydrolase [Solirubrobacteraceae bacterium]|nr:fenitrothion hydrolase [Solirubrobacteraceae bacterium]